MLVLFCRPEVLNKGIINSREHLAVCGKIFDSQNLGVGEELVGREQQGY